MDFDNKSNHISSASSCAQDSAQNEWAQNDRYQSEAPSNKVSEEAKASWQ